MEEAFRLIQTGKHVGQVVLTVEPDQQVKVVEPRPKLTQLKPDATYIVVGGFGGLGKQVVSWMADRGTSNIVAFSRSGKIDAESQTLISKLKMIGTSVSVMKCDVASTASLRETIAHIQSTMPPIRGAIQSAMVLRDVLYDDMTASDWSEAFAPKVTGTWNLHSHLSKSDLDFFVVLSSAVAISGNIGLSSYAAACAFQDSLAQYRQRIGLPAHSINVGAIADAGHVSENPEVATTLRRHGLGTVTIHEFLAHLNHVISGNVQRCQSSLGLTPAGDERGLGPIHWMSDKKYVLLGQHNQS
ncbi:MAG: hypothetical protein Q9227_007317 [Pyrenula ochraceoflavens]